MNKLAAEKIASEYYNIGVHLALQNSGLLKVAKPSMLDGVKDFFSGPIIDNSSRGTIAKPMPPGEVARWRKEEKEKDRKEKIKKMEREDEAKVSLFDRLTGQAPVIDHSSYGIAAKPAPPEITKYPDLGLDRLQDMNTRKPARKEPKPQ